MSRFTEAADRAESERDEGVTHPPFTAVAAYDQGEAWMRRLLERHGIDLDEVIDRENRGADVYLGNIIVLVATHQVDFAMAVRAAYAGGYTNGLAVGLEYGAE